MYDCGKLLVMIELVHRASQPRERGSVVAHGSANIPIWLICVLHISKEGDAEENTVGHMEKYCLRVNNVMYG